MSQLAATRFRAPPFSPRHCKSTLACHCHSLGKCDARSRDVLVPPVLASHRRTRPKPGERFNVSQGLDDSRCWRATFPTHRVSPSNDAGKSILSVRPSPVGSTSWLVKVRATVSRAVATSHRRYEARSMSPKSPRS